MQNEDGALFCILCFVIGREFDVQRVGCNVQLPTSKWKNMTLAFMHRTRRERLPL
jgi:hypothetical protein